MRLAGIKEGSLIYEEGVWLNGRLVFSLSFSFVSLDSFPFPPLEETAAPTKEDESRY